MQRDVDAVERKVEEQHMCDEVNGLGRHGCQLVRWHEVVQC